MKNDAGPEFYLEVPDVDPEFVVVMDDGLELGQEAGDHLVLALDLVMAALFVQHQEGIYQALKCEPAFGRLQDLETENTKLIQVFTRKVSIYLCTCFLRRRYLFIIGVSMLNPYIPAVQQYYFNLGLSFNLTSFILKY